MKIVIYGANETACLIAAKLYEDHDIVVIDDTYSNNDEFQKLDVEYVQGSGSNISILEAIGIKDADIFIACSDDSALTTATRPASVSFVITVSFLLVILLLY